MKRESKMKFLNLLNRYISIIIVYRFQIFSKFLVQLFQLVMVIFVWKYIYTQTDTVSGYDETQMISYIYIITMIGVIFNISIAFRETEHIKMGYLSHFLIRPISYTKDLAAFYLSTLIIDLIILLILIMIPLYFSLININLFNIISLTYFVLSIILFFYFIKTIANCAFWIIHTWPLKPLYNSLYLLFAGGFFPLDILPDNIYHILEYLPFSLFGYINVISLQGLIYNDIYKYFIATVIWIAIFIILEKISWRKGLKKYESVGL